MNSLAQDGDDNRTVYVTIEMVVFGFLNAVVLVLLIALLVKIYRASKTEVRLTLCITPDIGCDAQHAHRQRCLPALHQGGRPYVLIGKRLFRSRGESGQIGALSSSTFDIVVVSLGQPVALWSQSRNMPNFKLNIAEFSNRIMEPRVCPIHSTRKQQTFCWDCQQLICPLCASSHSAAGHTTVNLLKPINNNLPEFPTTQLKLDHEENQPADKVSAENPAELVHDEEPDSNPSQSQSPAGPKCTICGEAEPVPKTILGCTHAVHASCLKQYVATSNVPVERSWRRVGASGCFTT